MERPIDGKPVQLATLVLIEHIPLNTSQVAQFAFFDMYQKLHIIPDNMILLLMLLKTILLPIQNIPLYPTNETKTVLILLQAFLLLPDLRELIDDDGSYNLIHDDLDDE